MAHQGIVNIINFIRAVEPRDSRIDLLEPIRQQIRLIQAHNLQATWLIQYDALQDPRIIALLKEGLDDRQEIGIWFEVVQPLVEAIGSSWRGRFPWDWHSHVGFSIGYAPDERRRMAERFMADFKSVFGLYPRSVGSWLLDAPLLAHLADRYDLSAGCICKDQWGTDGYSLWGGYYNQAFYPSRKNGFMPAQTANAQIPLPLFRMLGSDPIDQYDAGLEAWTGDPSTHQHVITLEPVYAEGTGAPGGGNPDWVRWFFKTNFSNPSLAFAYTQVGQENSFGWPAMAAGLQMQIPLVAEGNGKTWRVETLETSGRWFKNRFATTPATAVTAVSDFRGQPRQSVWYNSRHYRLNAICENGAFSIRDIHRFDENYPERYLQNVCLTADCLYDTLPLLNGYHWSGPDCRASLRCLRRSADGNLLPNPGSGPLAVTELDANSLRIDWDTGDGETLEWRCRENTLEVSWRESPRQPRHWVLEMNWSDRIAIPLRRIEPQTVTYRQADYAYTWTCLQGHFEGAGNTALRLFPEAGRLILRMDA
jgi:hypothetical protein